MSPPSAQPTRTTTQNDQGSNLPDQVTNVLVAHSLRVIAHEAQPLAGQALPTLRSVIGERFDGFAQELGRHAALERIVLNSHFRFSPAELRQLHEQEARQAQLGSARFLNAVEGAVRT